MRAALVRRVVALLAHASVARRPVAAHVGPLDRPADRPDAVTPAWDEARLASHCAEPDRTVPPEAARPTPTPAWVPRSHAAGHVPHQSVGGAALPPVAAYPPPWRAEQVCAVAMLAPRDPSHWHAPQRRHQHLRSVPGDSHSAAAKPPVRHNHAVARAPHPVAGSVGLPPMAKYPPTSLAEPARAAAMLATHDQSHWHVKPQQHQRPLSVPGDCHSATAKSQVAPPHHDHCGSGRRHPGAAQNARMAALRHANQYVDCARQAAHDHPLADQQTHLNPVGRSAPTPPVLWSIPLPAGGRRSAVTPDWRHSNLRGLDPAGHLAADHHELSPALCQRDQPAPEPRHQHAQPNPLDATPTRERSRVRRQLAGCRVDPHRHAHSEPRVAHCARPPDD